MSTPESTSTGARSAALRWMPLAIPGLTLLLALALWLLVSFQEADRIRGLVDLEAERVAAEISAWLRYRIEGIVRMGQGWVVLDRATRQDWESEVAFQRRLEPALETVVWVDPDYQVRWVAPADVAAERLAVVAEGGGMARRALERARSTRSATVVGTVGMPDGDRGIQVGVPVVRGTGLAGWIVGYFELATILHEAFQDVGTAFTLVVTEGDQEIYARYPEEETLDEWGRSAPVSYDGLSLVVRVAPTARTLSMLHSALPRIILIAGVALAIVLGLVMRLARVASLRSQEAEAARRLQREIAARRRAERSLEQRARELARSNEEFERFATAVSHDLRSPLNSIAMNLELLRERLSDDAEAGRYLGRCVSAVGRTKEMIEGLLEYAKVGHSAREQEPVEAAEALETSLANLEMEIRSSGARITHDDLPAVRVDGAKLTQLFQNLIGNALKFSGDRTPRVHIGAEERGPEVLFAVRDNGVGIDQSQRHHVFDLFWREGDRQEHSGTGVGLAICKKIVESHGGRIWAESPSGEGTVFYFTLPAESSLGA